LQLTVKILVTLDFQLKFWF